jgi:hypothetical protein
MEFLFISKSNDWIEASGLAGGPDTEHDPDDDAEADCDHHGRRVEDESPAGIDTDAE